MTDTLPGCSSTVGMQLRAEEEAVLLCARADLAPSQEERLDGLWSDARFDWGRFSAIATQQQVTPLVSQKLTTQRTTRCLPSPVVQAAKAALLETVLHNMAAHGELLRIADALQEEQIPVVPLKGTHLAERLYENLGARQSGDIDILVPADQVTAARSVLAALEYSPSTGLSPGRQQHAFHGVPYVRLHAGRLFVVELHWGLNDPQFVTIDYSKLWTRVLVASRSSEPLRPLPAEETLVFLALHMPKHDSGVLRLLADIDRLIRRESADMQWSYVVDLARQWNGAWLTYFALERAQLLLDTPVPDWVLDALRPASWRRTMVDLFAGSTAILRPSESSNLRANQYRLAYCAMLNPVGRAVRAYTYYIFFPPLLSQDTGESWKPQSATRRLAHGIAWTSLALTSSLAQRGNGVPHTANGLAPGLAGTEGDTMGQGKGDQHDLIEMYTELTDWRAVAIVLAIVILLLLVTWLPPFGLIS